jgi:uncharacterized protein
VTTLAGAFLVGKLSSYVVQGIFGVFLLLFAGLSAFGPGVRLPASKTTALAGGLCSGFIAGLIGTGGAVRAVFLLAFGLRKETYIATSAAVALVIDGSRIPVYLAQGFVTERWLVPLVLLFGVAWLGAWTGKRIVTRVPAQAFMKVVLLALAAMGMKLMWAGFAAG